jgi:hypothetical protein
MGFVVAGEGPSLQSNKHYLMSFGLKQFMIALRILTERGDEW